MRFKLESSHGFARYGLFKTVQQAKKNRPNRFRSFQGISIGRRFAAALWLPRLFGTNPRSHHKGASGRVWTRDQRLPVLCHCQLGQDIPIIWKAIGKSHSFYYSVESIMMVDCSQASIVSCSARAIWNLISRYYSAYKWIHIWIHSLES